MLRIGIDLDNTITYCPEFFAAVTQALQGRVEIHIITNRNPTRSEEKATRRELREMGIAYDRLVLTAEKTDYILMSGINVFFDDMDENICPLPEKVRAFKMREPGGFDFEMGKWLYSHRTGRLVEEW